MMFSANLSPKNPNDVATFGAHREEKTRRSIHSGSDKESVRAASRAGSRPPTRSGFTKIFSRKKDEFLPAPTVAPSMVSLAESTESTATNVLAEVSQNDITLKGAISEVQEIGPESTVTRKTTVKMSFRDPQIAQDINDGSLTHNLQNVLDPRLYTEPGLYTDPRPAPIPRELRTSPAELSAKKSDPSMAITPVSPVSSPPVLSSTFIPQRPSPPPNAPLPAPPRLAPGERRPWPLNWSPSISELQNEVVRQIDQWDKQWVPPSSWETSTRPKHRISPKTLSSVIKSPVSETSVPASARLPTVTPPATIPPAAPLAAPAEAPPVPVPAPLVATKLALVSEHSIFGETLRSIESASFQHLTRHLTDDLAEAVAEEDSAFERRLWSIMALRRLDFANSLKEVQLHASSKTEWRSPLKVLSLYEPTADAWVLAMQNPDSIVQRLSQSTADPYIWGSAPANTSRIHSPTISTLPFAASSFSVLSGMSLQPLLRADQWPGLLQECSRVLRPGGSLLLSLIDPMPINAGPLMQKWTAGLILRLEAKFHSSRTTMLLPLWLGEISSFEPLSQDVIGFSAVPEFSDDPLKGLVGRSLYRSMFESYIQKWWWDDEAILDECRRLNTSFELCTFRCKKISS